MKSARRTRTRIAPLGSVAAAAMLIAAGASPAAAASGTGEFAAAHPEAGPLALASAAVAAVAGGYGLKLMRRHRAAQDTVATGGQITAQQVSPEDQLAPEPVNSAAG